VDMHGLSHGDRPWRRASWNYSFFG
jgi:hypothetical protein